VAVVAGDGMADGCGSLATAAPPRGRARLIAASGHAVLGVMEIRSSGCMRLRARHGGPSTCEPRHRPPRRPGGIVGAPLVGEGGVSRGRHDGL